MSKAEERAKERYSIVRGDDTQETSGIDMQRASDFIEGYRQAQKDNELTWEDMREICTLSVLVEIDLGRLVSDERHYTEVLNRFNKQKGK